MRPIHPQHWGLVLKIYSPSPHPESLTREIGRPGLVELSKHTFFQAPAYPDLIMTRRVVYGSCSAHGTFRPALSTQSAAHKLIRVSMVSGPGALLEPVVL
ncbi:hypothetical protein U0070_000813 [Myodes glareolus]|uniref:Uncharacterized protein n=1 Tax=Myodes glareolus TaxID=447135 RepID=A0AAW0HR78_MYOGA